MASSRLLRSLCVWTLVTASYFAASCEISLLNAGELQYTGVNLSGAEFGSTSLPGTFGSSYTYPTSAEVDYYTNKGMNTFRLPFRWERLQQTPNATLNATELSRMDTFVNYATSKGDYVLIDPHNFERYYPSTGNQQSSTNGLVGGTTADSQSSYNSLNGGTSGNVVVTNSMFANFWGQIAAHYANNSHVIFDLMNEPNSVSASQVAASDNAAIAAIRAAGANQMVLVEGTSYTGAWTWTTSSGNDSAFLPANIVDPDNNWAVEMHQYMDSDGSGTHTTINNNDPMTGVERLTAATQWLETNHVRGFLGEFAVANSIINPSKTDTTTLGNAVIENTLNYLQANSSAWIGWTWWGGGPWWGGAEGNPNANPYIFGLDPKSLTGTVTDQNAMYALSNFLPKAGDFNRDGHVDASDIASMEAALTDINGWYASETAQGLNSIQENIIADVNKDGVVNNADLQQLINILLAGGGSGGAVPEPASWILIGLAMLVLPTIKRRHSAQ